jgi:miniconductance mechanosensitive channel|tara:strand:- start:292 stop:1506 length:1215 start_codon:yes stop_codon:yes gene_type:complete
MVLSLDSIFSQYPLLLNIIPIVSLLFVSYIAFKITRIILIKILVPQIKKSKTKLDDSFLKNKLFLKISYVIPLLIIYNFSYVITDNVSISSSFLDIVITIISIFVFARIIDAFLSSITDAYSKKYKRIPLKSYIQIVKIFVFIFAALIAISVLSGRSPWVLLGSLGAISAVLLLIFRDTILSFMANLQISSNNLIQLHDWVEAPAFGADGDVIEIALHTIKVQNWDKTITVIPTHKLIDSSFKNWRGMEESGGRRIKRAINIDMSSIKFCNESMIEKYMQIDLLSDYLKEKIDDISDLQKKKSVKIGLNSRQLTNVGTFREYVKSYLRNHAKVNHDMTFLIRQLSPTENGLPLEIYVFSNDNEWINYENIQADIFDHLLAAVSYFDLRVFQHPSGHDFNKFSNN